MINLGIGCRVQCEAPRGRAAGNDSRLVRAPCRCHLPHKNSCRLTARFQGLLRVARPRSAAALLTQIPNGTKGGLVIQTAVESIRAHSLARNLKHSLLREPEGTEPAVHSEDGFPRSKPTRRVNDGYSIIVGFAVQPKRIAR
jgi:hypothetical protein